MRKELPYKAKPHVPPSDGKPANRHVNTFSGTYSSIPCPASLQVSPSQASRPIIDWNEGAQSKWTIAENPLPQVSPLMSPVEREMM